MADFDLNVGMVGGAAVGGAGAYGVTRIVANSLPARLLTNGPAHLVGSKAGAYAATHVPDVLGRGIGIELAQGVNAGSGLGRVVADGVAGHLGADAPHVPQRIAVFLRTVAKDNPRWDPLAKVTARMVEGAPAAVGSVVGAGYGVGAASKVRGAIPIVGAVVGASIGAYVGAQLLDIDIPIGF